MDTQTYFANKHISKTAKILRLLLDKGTVTNVELNKICYRYSARVHELRKEGHMISTLFLGDGLYSYTYKGIKREKEYDEVA